MSVCPSSLSHIIRLSNPHAHVEGNDLIPHLATELVLGFVSVCLRMKLADTLAEIYTQIVTCVIGTIRRYLPPYRQVEE